MPPAKQPASGPFLAPPEVISRRAADSRWSLRSAPLDPPIPTVLHRLRRWAEAAPERPFLAERDRAGDWRRLSYAEAAAATERVAQGLLDRGLSARTNLAILSENTISNAVLRLAAMTIGVPVVPVSPSYSLVSRDFARLRAIISVTEPVLVYVEDAARYAPALATLDLRPRVVAVRNADGWPGAEPLERLAAAPTAAVAEAFEAVTPDTVAAIFFTSGSTGDPKGVVTTQRMICANQQAIAQVWPFLAERPPVLLDWLPWHHTFGGNDNLHKILWHGGTLFIDRGRPVPDLFEASVANLREVQPTLYINVPRGMEMLLPRLQGDAGLREALFRRLDLIFFAGAALPGHVWEGFRALARGSEARTGRRVALVSGYGCTEAGSTICLGCGSAERPDAIGPPLPGFELRLAPVGARLEVRVRGPNVTPGYWRRPDLTAAAFDAEGYYRTADAARPLDPDDPRAGLVFDGRLADEFKLTTGTWVAAGAIRAGVLMACAATVQDAVVIGQGRAGIGLLAFADLERCRRLCGPDARTLADAALAGHPAVRRCFARDLARWNAAHPRSSERIARALLIAEAPDVDAGELTDKGQLNRFAVVSRRADLVRRLYDEPPPADVVALDADEAAG